MHLRNGDAQYINCEDAMCYWPETATAIATRLTVNGDIEYIAPFGLTDLFEFNVRPTPHFIKNKMEVFKQRRAQKKWHTHWSEVRYV